MFGNNREDDLLNKLKNCIGSLKGETPVDRSIETRMKNHYITLKENHTNMNPHPLQPMNYQSFNESIVQNRQPLINKNNINEPFNAYPSNRYGKPDVQSYVPPERQRSYDAKSFEPTPRKFEYPMPVDRLDREPQPTAKFQPQQESINNNNQGIKGELARRYSHIQQKPQSKHPQFQSHTARPSSNYTVQRSQDRGVIRNYQRQVEQRKQILEDRPLNRVELHEKSSKEQAFGNLKRQVFPSQNEIIRSHQPLAQQYPLRKSSHNSAAKQALRKEYEEQGSRECSALGKLRKISQLNQKINERIRNIINVFEQNKC